MKGLPVCPLQNLSRKIAEIGRYSGMMKVLLIGPKQSGKTLVSNILCGRAYESGGYEPTSKISEYECIELLDYLFRGCENIGY